jgi:hypothetical protein
VVKLETSGWTDQCRHLLCFFICLHSKDGDKVEHPSSCSPRPSLSLSLLLSMYFFFALDLWVSYLFVYIFLFVSCFFSISVRALPPASPACPLFFFFAFSHCVMSSSSFSVFLFFVAFFSSPSCWGLSLAFIKPEKVLCPGL